jgi:hypothetical protein
MDVFRRSEDIPTHLDDILAAKPKAVWFQSGIRNDEVAERLAQAGSIVVQDDVDGGPPKIHSSPLVPFYLPAASGPWHNETTDPIQAVSEGFSAGLLQP